MLKNVKILILFFLGIYAYPQESVPKTELTRSAQACFALIKTNPEAAFEKAKAIEKKALKAGIPEPEMQAIIVQCIYFRRKNDFERMMSRAKLLYKKAKYYESDIYRLMAGRYLF